MEFKVYDYNVVEIMDFLRSRNLVSLESQSKQEYTIKHKQAFMAVQLALTGRVTESAFRHDTEKLVLYGIVNSKSASNIHRAYATHHIENAKTKNDLQDCIIDYECARFTKKDKPLNAYKTIQKYYAKYYEILKPTLIKMGLDSPETREIDFSLWEKRKYDILKCETMVVLNGIETFESFVTCLGIDNAMAGIYSQNKQ